MSTLASSPRRPVPTPQLTQGISAELSQTRDSIVRQFPEVERTFLQVGAGLQSLCESIANLSDSAREAAQGVTDHCRAKALPELAVSSADLLAELVDDTSRIEDSLAAVTKITESLRQLHEATSKLGPVARRLNTIRLYMEIESARSTVTQSAFAAFTDEMRKLGNLVTQTSVDLAKDEHGAQLEQNGAKHEIANGFDDFRRFMTDAERATSEATATIDVMLEGMEQSLERVATHSQKVGQLIDDIVVMLQFNDITRQQLEHVVTSIAEAEHMIASQDPEQLEHATLILRVQHAHLEEAANKVREVQQKVALAFEATKREVEEVVAALPKVCKRGQEEQNPFETLETNVKRLIELQSRARMLDERSARSAASASDTSALLEKHVNNVRRVASEMELRAFNAAIKSARLGQDGLALKVLSTEVTRLASGSTEFVSDTVAHLREVSEASHALQASCKTQSHGSTAAQELEQLLAAMGKASNQMSEVCLSVTRKAHALEEHIAEYQQSITFLADYSKNLSTQKMNVENALGKLQPWATKADIGNGTGMTHLTSRYTMESERSVFQRIAQQETQSAGHEDSLEEGGCILF